MAEEFDPLIREVDDDVRRDRMEALWKQYGLVIMVALLAVVGLVGGVQFWHYAQEERAKEAALAYYQALEAKADDKEDAGDLLANMAKRGGEGYGGLAAMQQAAMFEDNGQIAAAYDAYRAIADHAEYDWSFRDLGLLLAGYLAFHDQADIAWQDDVAAAVEKRLQAGSAVVYPGLFQEWLALFHMKHARYADAQGLLDAILADPESPTALIERVEQLMAQLRLQLPAEEEIDHGVDAAS